MNPSAAVLALALAQQGVYSCSLPLSRQWGIKIKCRVQLDGHSLVLGSHFRDTMLCLVSQWWLFQSIFPIPSGAGMIVELVGGAWMWRGFVPYGHGVQFDVHDCAHLLVSPQSVFNNLCNRIWKHPCRFARCVGWIE